MSFLGCEVDVPRAVLPRRGFQLKRTVATCVSRPPSAVRKYLAEKFTVNKDVASPAEMARLTRSVEDVEEQMLSKVDQINTKIDRDFGELRLYFLVLLLLVLSTVSPDSFLCTIISAVFKK
ncbi:hypothetical protein CHLRE_08g360650v5 [Chlamydomonas reinhardtii]|uniref:Uncharacterized protein n=1 Tax=Chlamydomonas reinhardtii TaxID=3055 RepID=A0A2K3DGG8_CHLRE|nr:uncharacterized protein CHLRE_08g360650v5 [Chlamydomonas reinhardtii]PNW79628.1 hypothetical protein CHLRE_08g360650v5 [Chlamydomonas reinhardtii]